MTRLFNRTALSVAALAAIAAAFFVGAFGRDKASERVDVVSSPPTGGLMFALLNRSGRPVTDLTRNQVKVFEDGRARETVLARGWFDGTNAKAAASTVQSVLVIWDDLHMDGVAQKRARELCATLLRSVLSTKDRVAVVSTGPAGIAIDYTTDRHAVLSALPSLLSHGGADKKQAPPPTPGDDHVALSTVYGILTRLGAVAGSKAVVWIGGSYSFAISSPAAIASQIASDPFSTSPAGAVPDALDKMLLQLAAAANSAGVVVHAFDPTEPQGTRVRDPQPVLATLAALTGGGSAQGASETERALPMIQTSAGHYYRIRYTPSAPTSSLRLREIRVVVERPDLSMDQRRWVLAGT